MSDLNTVYVNAIKTVLWPAFKALGYKKQGNNFRYYSADGWGKIVQFQKSRWNSPTELQFTVNVGLYLSEIDYYLCGREAGTNFDESACVVRKRIDKFKPSTHNEWFTLTDATDTKQLFITLHQDFSHYILPFLASVTSRESIYRILTAGHQSHYPVAQIEAMFWAGYQEAATSLFSKEVARSQPNRYYQTTLRALAQRLGLPAELWTGKL